MLPSDSLEVLSLYQNNCPHCSWKDINSPRYWDLSQPMSTWYGVAIVSNRVDSLDLRINGLVGQLPSLDLPQLRRLHIGNIVPSIAGFDHLLSLEYLNLDSRGLHSIPPLDSLHNLQTLILKDALISQAPELDFPHQLTALSLINCNHIAALPELDSCGSLTFLEVSSCPNIAFPDLSPCGQLRELRIRDCGLDSLPGLLNCPLLNHLDLSENNLSHLPPLHHLNQLSTLNLAGNSLSFYYLEAFQGLSNFTYLPMDTLPVLSRDTLMRLAAHPGDLPAHLTGGSGTQVNWYKNGALVSISDSIPSAGSGFYELTLSHTQMPGSLAIHPQYIYLDEDPVTCGNTNADGRIDMQDLAVLGLYYGSSGLPRDSFGQSPAPAWPWVKPNGMPQDFSLAGDTLNMKHADCNGDGILDELDLNCIDQNYQALQLNQFLSSSVQDSIKLRASALVHQAYFIDSHRVRIPFRIEIDELPPSMDSILLKGVIFTRPVTESNHYHVDSIHAEFHPSDFILSAEEPIYLQKYHPGIAITPQPGSLYSCTNGSSHPLDVGIFNKYRSRRMEQGNCILNCTVTIDDILRSDNPHNQNLNNIPIVSQIYQAVVYVQNDQGDFVALAAGCTSDTAWINPDSLFQKVRISGKSYNQDLLTLAGVSYELDGGRNEEQEDLSGMGFSFPLDPHHFYRIRPHKSMDSASLAALDVIDLYMLAQYMSGNLSLSPYQIIASDLNRDEVVRRADYQLLEDLISGSIRTLPGDQAWVFLPDDHVFTNPAAPFPFPQERIYPQPQSLSNQDFTGIQLGDLDQSWIKPQKQAQSSAYSLYAADIEAVSGSVVEIPLVSKRPYQAGALQFSLEWTPDVMEYQSYSSPIEGFRVVSSESKEGRLHIIWVCPDGRSHHYHKDGEILKLRFLMRGKTGSSSILQLSGQGFTPKGCRSDLEPFSIEMVPSQIRIHPGNPSEIPGSLAYPNLRVWPQPLTEQSKASYFLPAPARVQISLFDAQGTRVAYFQKDQPAGRHSFDFRACFPRLALKAGGLYFIDFQAEGLHQSLKVLISPQ